MKISGNFYSFSITFAVGKPVRILRCTDFALYGLGGLCLILVKMKSHV